MRDIIAESVERVDLRYRANGARIPESSVLCQMCLDTGKWGMFLCQSSREAYHEVFKAKLPYLADPRNHAVLYNGYGFFLFDSLEDLETAFRVMVDPGDIREALDSFHNRLELGEHPGLPDDSDPARFNIWMLSCSPDGVEWDERDA